MSATDAAAPSFEVGPIRPPNEAHSLLVRVTRNCPYNRCSFCPVYKGTKFSLRSADEVVRDIRAMAAVAARLEEGAQGAPGEGLSDAVVLDLMQQLPGVDVLQVARFLATGGRTAFLQDANSLIMPVDELLRVLEVLREAFPSLRRVTSYARSHTVTKRQLAELTGLRQAGLDRIHIGLESGSDQVLELAGKGVTSARHVAAGRLVKEAGIELSEYVMPGLGGRALSDDHARRTAETLQAIDPDFIRLRTLALSPRSPLAERCRQGEFEPLDDVGVARELRTLLSGLTGLHGTIRSDHALNLLEEISGRLPGDLPRLVQIVDRFLGLDEAERDLFIVGRRFGVLRRLDDLEDPPFRARAEAARQALRARHPGPVDRAIRELMARFV